MGLEGPSFRCVLFLGPPRSLGSHGWFCSQTPNHARGDANPAHTHRRCTAGLATSLGPGASQLRSEGFLYPTEPQEMMHAHMWWAVSTDKVNLAASILKCIQSTHKIHCHEEVVKKATTSSVLAMVSKRGDGWWKQQFWTLLRQFTDTAWKHLSERQQWLLAESKQGAPSWAISQPYFLDDSLVHWVCIMNHSLLKGSFHTSRAHALLKCWDCRQMTINTVQSALELYLIFDKGFAKRRKTYLSDIPF